MDPIRKYQNYDFFMDDNWRSYSSNLFPHPTSSQMEKIRRKWYQANIDPSFDVKFDSNENPFPEKEENSQEKPKEEEIKEEPEEELKQENDLLKNKSENFQEKTQENKEMPKHTHGPNCNHSHQHTFQQANPQTTATEPKTSSTFTNILFYIEGFLKFNFLMTFVMMPTIANWIAFTICCLALLRQCKRPRWTREYGEKIVFNEYFHNIWYMLPFLFFPRAQGFIYFAPLTIHIWIAFCEFVNLKGGNFLKFLKNPVEKTRQQRNYLILMKQKLEIFHLFHLIVFLFFGQSNLLILLLYSNYLRVKYVVNRHLVMAFFEIDLWIRNHIVKESSPRIFKWIYDKICRFCSYMVTPSNIKKDQNPK